jgi:hypothetical protein
VLLRSLLLFWPNDALHLLLVWDDESAEDHELAQQMEEEILR